METTKFETFLPLFPGFYGTHLESDDAETSELDYINEQRAENGLEPIEWDKCEFDYDEYHQRVSKAYTNAVEHELKSLGLVKNIEFQKLISPKEYNFSTDSIDVEIDVNIENLQKYIAENKQKFIEYLKEKYTSCSGFISSYSTDFDVWSEDTDTFTNFECNGHYLGSILDFILSNEGVEYDLELINGDTNFITVTNFDELTTK
jgi:beta-galactosidase GanA